MGRGIAKFKSELFRLTEPERTMVVGRDWGRGRNGELLFNGCRVVQDERNNVHTT